MISPDLAETVKRIRTRHLNVHYNFPEVREVNVDSGNAMLQMAHRDRGELLDALEGLERAVAFKDETNARLQACLEGEVKLKARVTSLESSLAEARKGARTKGTVEVCAECGGNYEDGKAAFAIHDCPGLNDRPCPIRLAQETAP